jgi:hypothetical protein
MTSKRLSWIFLLALLATVPSLAVAQETKAPVSAGGDDQEPQHRAFDAATLFDPIGVPLLRISGPEYLQLGPRPKLRFRNDGTPGDLGGGAGAIGGIGPVSGGGGIAPPLPWVPGDEIPEPAVLALLVPAMALALRRHARRRATRA